MKFKRGNKVRKIKGYTFDGVVVSGFLTLQKKERYVVEIEEVKPYGWCSCGKQHKCPIDRFCKSCHDVIELIQHPNNCAGMLHIFGADDLELRNK